MAYKWCVVPQCTNTSLSSPQKLFVSVPTNPKRRKMWLQLARRDPKSISSQTNVFMCEDHFNMEKDTINYMKYKMGFSQKILLADEAVPTKFHCQEDRKRGLSDAGSSREVFLKRQRIHLVTECLQTQDATETHTESLQKDDDMIQEIIEPEELLHVKGIKLLRPPSVNAGAKLSKTEVRETKLIASLRIHIERVIRRLRESHMLKQHSMINSNILRILDHIIIACALINLQDSLIK